jgi:hypothetical protein
LVAQLLLDHGAFLGSDLTPGFLDSLGWYQRFVAPLVTSRFFPARIGQMPDLELEEASERLLRDMWPSYWAMAEPVSAWGWKYPETLFVMPCIRALFPSARVVHVVRDVRDVCLSDNGFFQITGSHADPPGWSPARLEGLQPSYLEFCTAVTFGRPGVTTWQGISLRDRAALTRNRFQLQAQAWVTAVEWARAHGRRLGRDYLEVRYEDLCREPRATANRVLSFALLVSVDASDAALRRIRTDRLARWRRARLTLAERRDFANAVDLAGKLMRETGYPA